MTEEKLTGISNSLDQRCSELEQTAAAAKGHMNAFFETLKGQKEGLAETSEQATAELAKVSDNLAESSRELTSSVDKAAALMSLVTDGMQRQGQEVSNAAEYTSSKVNMVADSLNRNLEELRNASQKTIEQLDHSGLGLRQRVSDISDDAGRVAQKIDHVAKALDERGSQLGVSTQTAMEKLNHVGESIRQRAEDAANMTSQTVSRLAHAEEAMRRQANETGREGEMVSNRLEGNTSALKNEMKELTATFNRALISINAIGDVLEKNSDKAGIISEQAVAQIEKAQAALSKTTEGFSSTASSVFSQGQALSKSLGTHTAELTTASRDAARLTKALKEHHDNVGAEDFMRTSSLIQESLQSIAVDITRILEISITEDDWKRYTKGDKGIFVRKLVGFRDKSKLPLIKQKYEKDGEFREYIDRFHSQYDSLLSKAAQGDHSGALTATFLTSDVGKLHSLLNRALGKETKVH